MGLRIVSCGEILWDIFPTGPVLGGAPLNFAFRVNNLGHQGLVASAVGEDAQGDALLEAMARLGLDAGLVQRDPGHPTGRVDIRFDLAKNPSYTIVPGVAYEFLQYEERLAAAVAAADCFCFSTLAQREPVFSATLQRLLAAAAGGQILYDINLRKGCYTPEMIRTSLAAATILKLNEEEAEEVGRLLYGRTLLVRDVAERLILGGGLRTCVVTLGQKGSYAVDADGRSAYSPGFAVDLVDPCGAGDSFAAGFMCALLSGGALGEACELGNALGALTSAQNGATTPITIASVEALRRRPGARVADPEYPLLSV
jgi:fructokinase